jgi:hypothetical protein
MTPLIEYLKPLSALVRQDFTWPERATRREIKRCRDQYQQRLNQIADCYHRIYDQLHDERVAAAREAGLLETDGDIRLDFCYNALRSCKNGNGWRNVDCGKATRILCCNTIQHIANDILRNWRKRNSPQYFYHFGGPGVVIQETTVKRG